MEEETLENKNIVTETENKIPDTEGDKIENKTEEISEKEIPEITEEIKQEVKQEVKAEDFVAPIEKGRLSGLKTFSQDVAKAVEKNEGTIVRELLEEQTERDIEEKEFSPESKKNRFFIFGGMGLFILALIFVIIVFVSSSNFFAKDITLRTSPVIFVEENDFLDITGLEKDKIVEKIRLFNNSKSFKIKSIVSFYLTEKNKIVGFKEFMQKINADVKDNYFSVIDDVFMFGLIDTREGAIVSSVGGDMFMLIKVKSFSDVFPVFRDWENKIFINLAPLWGFDLNMDNAYLLTKDFEDDFIFNKNARVLKDLNGDIVFMYIFVDENTVVFAKDGKVLNEIVARILAGRVRR